MWEGGRDATKRTGHAATGPHIGTDQLIMMCSDYRHHIVASACWGIDPASFFEHAFIHTPRGYYGSVERRFLNFGDTP
jgi:hypothetical protein